ncbi:hypothetical protein GGI12_005604 [Dipsacomyces acuminosporus]|nr:hypothetical protein GGI12_005604 [Dipsacomyces acuminosporus]
MLKNIITIVLATSVAVNGFFIPLRIFRTPPTKAIATIKSSTVSVTVRFTDPKKKGDKGLGVYFNARGLRRGASYNYYINEKPVPANGDCSATGDRWDPSKIKVANKPYNCDKKNVEKTCQVGDLSGRQRKLSGNMWGKRGLGYNDSLLSVSGNNTIVGHSFVVYGPDNKHVGCANITAYKEGNNSKARKSGQSSAAASISTSASISGAVALVAAAIAF